MFRCRRDGGSSRWSPWLQALPPSFPAFFTKAEQDCLPFYAKYAADYQNRKFQAFVAAAAELGECTFRSGNSATATASDETATNDKDDDTADLQWAFQAVGSRFWKTAPFNPDEPPTTELVPIGDMFNHRDPPNVAITHEQDTGAVLYIHKVDNGNDDANSDANSSRDLFISPAIRIVFSSFLDSCQPIWIMYGVIWPLPTTRTRRTFPTWSLRPTQARLHSRCRMPSCMNSCNQNQDQQHKKLFGKLFKRNIPNTNPIRPMYCGTMSSSS